jgi:hypothetical protein
MSRRYPLTPLAEAQIVGAIRAGAFPHVAAEAAGIPRWVFDDYLRRGEGADAPARHRRFTDTVRQAAAHARLRAEIEALKIDVMSWLKHGPGRDTLDNPGWTNPVKPPSDDTDRESIRMNAMFYDISAALRLALEPFPEASKAATLALDALSRLLARARERPDTPPRH